MFACEREDVSVVELLLRQGADHKIRGKFGRTALEYCKDRAKRAQIQAVITSLAGSPAPSALQPLPLGIPRSTPTPPTPTSALQPPLSASTPTPTPTQPIAASTTATPSMFELHAQLASITSEKDSLRLQLADRTREKEALNAQLIERSSERDRAISLQTERQREQDAKLAVAAAERARLDAERNELVAQLGDRARETEVLNTQLSNLTTERAQLARERDIAVADITEVSAQAKLLQIYLDERIANNAALKSQLRFHILHGAGANHAMMLAHEAVKLNPAAACNLGLCYQHGYGVERNMVDALTLYLFATNCGYPEAACLFIILTFIGLGTRALDVFHAEKAQLVIHSIYMYLSLFETENGEAQCLQALRFACGFDEARDLERARALLDDSMGLGFPFAAVLKQFADEHGTHWIDVDVISTFVAPPVRQRKTEKIKQQQVAYSQQTVAPAGAGQQNNNNVAPANNNNNNNDDDNNDNNNNNAGGGGGPGGGDVGGGWTPNQQVPTVPLQNVRADQMCLLMMNSGNCSFMFILSRRVSGAALYNCNTTNLDTFKETLRQAVEAQDPNPDLEFVMNAISDEAFERLRNSTIVWRDQGVDDRLLMFYLFFPRAR